VIHVDGTAGNDTNTGTSWALAKKTVQAGLDAAASKVGTTVTESYQVWVKAGTYLPTVGTGREASIKLRDRVALYGGFGGTETELSARKITENKTILSGDLGVVGDASDNAFHVVLSAEGARLDGVTITAGNANSYGTPLSSAGGGIYSAGTSPTVANCTFIGNRAIQGAGMYLTLGSPNLTNCRFTGNAASVYGGGIYIATDSPNITGCSFDNNTAGQNGGGIHTSDGGSAKITNCTFRNNQAGMTGGAMNNMAMTTPAVSGCLFSKNTADKGGAMANVSASPTVTNSTFVGNTATSTGGALYNVSPGSGPQQFSHCTFAANTSANGGAAATNHYASNMRLTNSILWDKTSASVPEIANTGGSTAIITFSNVNGGCTTAASCTTNQTGNINADPLFVDASTEDLHLKAGSPAIDAADGCSSPLADKDGQSRIDIAAVKNTGRGPAVDMGAYEYRGGSSDTAAPAPSVQTCCTKNTTATAHDYWYCADSKSRVDAEAICKASQMSLAVVTSAAENELVCKLAGSGGVLIDATDSATEGTWRWSTGEAFAYANWNDGEPNNWNGDENCAQIDAASGNWNDVSCSTEGAFVCEYAK